MAHEAFLKAIYQTPDDDALRLVYADWLEEHGNSQRAEFIRLQIQQSQRGEPFPYWSEQATREEELLADHEADWRAELPELEGITWGEFERGFVSWAKVANAEAFQRHAETLFTRTAVRAVSLQKLADLEQFLSAAEVKHLTALRLDRARRIHTARALANCAHLTNLRSLNLYDSGLGDEGVKILANSPQLAHLSELQLRSNSLTAAGARALAEPPFLTELRALDLGGIDPENGGDNLIGTEGVRSLARSPNLGHLHSLQLDWNDLRDDAVRALAAATSLTNLRYLSLWANNLGPEGVAALATSTALPALSSLDLQANLFGSEGVAALAGSVGLPQLQSLSLWYCNLGDEGITALAASPRLASLYSLDLGNNGITLEGVRALANSPQVGQLRGLSLRGNLMDATALTLLARSPNLHNLVVLELSGLEGVVTNQILAELGWSENLSNLRSLGLSSCHLEGLSELARSPLAKRLTHLDLSHTKFGESDAWLLLDRSIWPRLVYLALRGLHLPPEMTVALQQCYGQRLNTERHWRWLVG